MSERTKRLAFSFMKRNAPRRGPTSSDAWNDCFDEVVNDLASMQAEWNNNLLPLFEALPNGTDDTTVDAWANGIDGNNIYVDASLTSSSAVLTYFDVGLNRPLTIAEALDDVYDRLVTEVATLSATISTGSTSSGGLTAAQKTSIGDHIFDSAVTSSSSSLDGKSENNRLNVLQLAKDLYGATYSLGNDGAADLTNSVADMVDALLALHNGNWSDDVTLSHSGISLSLTQTDIAQSASYNDAYGGSPSTLQDDLNQIRTRLKTIAGTTAWSTALPALYTGGADSIKDLLDATKGSGTKTSTNPWGYQYDNIDGLVTRLNAVRDFCGMGSLTDGTPLYSGQRFITNGQPLEFGISKLDQELYDHMLDGHVSLPTSEHWADSVQVEVGTRIKDADLQDMLEWAATPGTMTTGEQFRRYETGFVGSGLLVTHNRDSHPQVQLIQINPSVTISGQCPYMVNHTSNNAFQVIVTSGVLTSGVVVALW
jgi:hypothetical protein